MEFTTRCIKDFEKMHHNYINDLQNNFNANASRTSDKLDEMKSSITDQETASKELKRHLKTQKELMANFFKSKANNYYFRVCLAGWKYFHRTEKRKSRVFNYAQNAVCRYRKKSWFYAFRGETHKRFKEHIKTIQGDIERKLCEEKLNVWTNKVDGLKLYMQQLEEKIAGEIAEREQLAKKYEGSLNKGIKSLNRETEVLAENPLVREISLIVAKQLLS